MALRVVCEQVSAREVDRRLQKVYTLLSRPASRRRQDSPTRVESRGPALSSQETIEGGDR